MMGPDCGTALVAGAPLGFCNQVPAGPVGVVAASGTGAQAIASHLAHEGVGVNHILGTGGRDLQEEVGGLTTRMALEALAEDPSTEVVVLVSKPPAQAVREQIFDYSLRFPKPLILHFVGEDVAKREGNIYQTVSLSHAAQTAAGIARGGESLADIPDIVEAVEPQKARLRELKRAFDGHQRWAKGLFSGGTLADEAAFYLAKHVHDVKADKAFGKVQAVEDWNDLSGNLVMDLGADHFTKSRPHPMIDPALRLEWIRSESKDPSSAVILLDVVLGHNAHRDPAAALVPVLKEAHQTAADQGRSLAIFGYVCGTKFDPQGYESQVTRLRQAGCLIFPSNDAMALAAAWMLKNRGGV